MLSSKSIIPLISLLIIASFVKAQSWSSSGTSIYYNGGNVGVGTSTPVSLFHVNGQLTAGNAGGGYHLIVNDVPTARWALGTGDHGLHFANDYTNIWTERVLISRDGYMGIGTSWPLAMLHVNNAIAPANSVGSESQFARFSGSADLNSIHFRFLSKRHTLNQGWPYISGKLQFTTDFTDQGYVEFNPKDGAYGMALGTGNTEIMRMAVNGNVGIGTSTPLEKLQIGDRFVFRDGGWKGILSNVTWNANLATNVRMQSAPVAGIFFTDKGNTTFLNGPGNTAGSTLGDATYGMTIYSSGQVGIATSYEITSFTDLNYKLFVGGGLRARKVKVDQDNWSDYVFDSSYRLQSLREVEQFVKRHHHLPDVPTATDVNKNGLDLGDNQATLLKKIEELTLYIIDLNKTVEKQQLEIQLLAKRLKEIK